MTGTGSQSPLGAKPPPGTDRAISELNQRSSIKIFVMFFAVVLLGTAILLAMAFL